MSNTAFDIIFLFVGSINCQGHFYDNVIHSLFRYP